MREKRWRYEFEFKDLLTDDDSDDNAERVGGEIAERMGAIGQYPFPLWLRSAFEDAPGLAGLNNALTDLYDYADERGVWLGFRA